MGFGLSEIDIRRTIRRMDKNRDGAFYSLTFDPQPQPLRHLSVTYCDPACSPRSCVYMCLLTWFNLILLLDASSCLASSWSLSWSLGH